MVSTSPQKGRSGPTNRRLGRLLFAIILITALLGCTTSNDDNSNLSGQLLLWHDWEGPEAATLRATLQEFESLHPELDIIQVPVSANTIVARYADRTASALGPDLLLLGADSVYEMTAAGLLEEISPDAGLQTDRFLPQSLAAISDGQRVFGIPFSVHSNVLYYNRTLVDTPPATLDELTDRVLNGEQIAINSDFTEAIWGLGAYGGRLFDQSGQLALGQGGLINWIDYLQQARILPGFILDSSDQRLRNSFVNGEVAYYIGPSSLLPALTIAVGEQVLNAQQSTMDSGSEQATPAVTGNAETIGSQIVGVAPLPSGPNEWQASPLLQTDVLIFNRASSPREREVAMELAEFMTSTQQQASLAAAGIGRVPAIAQLGPSRSLPEATTALTRQARSALSIPFEQRPAWDELTDPQGPLALEYSRALQGLVSGRQFVADIVTGFGVESGLSLAAPDPASQCPERQAESRQTITIWHSLPLEVAEAFEDVAGDFTAACPGLELIISPQAAETILADYIEAASEGEGPDVLIHSSRSTSRLAELGLLADLGDYVRESDLEAYIPATARAMQYQGRLFGLPETVSITALFYNTDQVTVPPATLEDLRLDVNPERRWALPVDFFYGYWGLAPFGGYEFDSDEATIENSAGLEPWLTYLQGLQLRPGVDLTFDPNESSGQFARGEAAYLVGGPWMLLELQEALGQEGFRVAPLPSGPLGPASPMLQVEGFMVNANSTEAIPGTLALVRHVSQPESQEVLISTGAYIPARSSADLSANPLMAGFQEQAKLAAVVDENQAFEAMEVLGDAMYADVLLNGTPVDQAVATFLEGVENLTTADAAQP